MHEIDNPTMSTEHSNTINLNEKTMIIATNSMILLNTIALLDLDSFQVNFHFAFCCRFLFDKFLFLDNIRRRNDLTSITTCCQFYSCLLS